MIIRTHYLILIIITFCYNTYGYANFHFAFAQYERNAENYKATSGHMHALIYILNVGVYHRAIKYFIAMDLRCGLNIICTSV